MNGLWLLAQGYFVQPSRNERALAALPATWDFYGTTTTPREGKIACGYYVTTVLEQAGFHLQRVLLAQQASAYVVQTLARGTRVDWIRPAITEARVDRFDGLRVVGLGHLRRSGAQRRLRLTHLCGR